MPRPRKPPRGVVGAGGGVGVRRPSPKPGSLVVGGYTQPPALTYDPGIEAERRAAKRGLEDIETDVRAGRHFARRDLAQALRDIRTDTSRTRGRLNRDFARSRDDINRTTEREGHDLSERESDVRLKGERANQDFDTQLANIGRQFAQLGQRQGESANAAGVLSGGTQAASQVARGRNQQTAEAPVHVARQRVEEDLATALRRIGTAGGELGEDSERELAELGEDRGRLSGHLLQDRGRNRRLARREAGRGLFSLKHKLERARREQAFTDIDKTLQAIYQARANRPGAFTRAGERTNKAKVRRR